MASLVCGGSRPRKSGEHLYTLGIFISKSLANLQVLNIFPKSVILQVWIFAFNGFSGQPRAKRRYHGLVNMSGDWTWKIHSPVKKVVSVWTPLEERNDLQRKTNAGMQKRNGRR